MNNYSILNVCKISRKYIMIYAHDIRDTSAIYRVYSDNALWPVFIVGSYI